jgi:ABC-type amino acid transport substrate-binding protein
MLSLLAAVPAFAQAPKASNAPREDLTIDPETITQSWKGDLDQMVQRRMVRVLVVPSRTFYFNDKGTQRGITYDAFQLVEQELRKRIDRDKNPKRKHLNVRFFYVSVSRDKIFTALAEGKGDVAAANLSITPSRETLVDFAKPHLNDVREVVLTGPHPLPCRRSTTSRARKCSCASRRATTRAWSR